MAFGPHGPRTPTSQPGDGLKIFLAVSGLVGATVVLHQAVRHFGMSCFVSVCCVGWRWLIWLNLRASGQPAPKSMSKEWQEATNERAIEQKLNPISGTFSWNCLLPHLSVYRLYFSINIWWLR